MSQDMKEEIPMVLDTNWIYLLLKKERGLCGLYKANVKKLKL